MPAALGQDFATQIAPILQKHCIRCHSEADPGGEVSFTNAEGIASTGVVAAGSATNSRLIAVITPDDDGHAEMPQDASPLTLADRQLLTDWVNAGASWPNHVTIVAADVADRDWWSLRPVPTLSELKEANHSQSTGNPIDDYLAQQLSEQQLIAAPPAGADVLLRRVCYDLTGLPPKPELLRTFELDYQQDPERTWAATVDQLLDSHAFGEKWGQHWLDLARYAETHGYDKDKLRPNAWPYRDYVIQSLNADESYDRFVQEQIAGDILFPDQASSIVGLGFLAAGPWDFIGHVEVGEGKLDGRIAKHLDRDEMLSAVFNVFMSTTVQCAQCHHHKFDPIRMQDYYRTQAVFAGVDRADRSYRNLNEHDRAAVEQSTAELQSIEAEQTNWLAGLNNEVHQMSEGASRLMTEFLETNPIDLPEAYGYHSQIESKDDVEKWVQIDLEAPTEIRAIRLVPAFDHYANVGSGFGFPTRFQIAISDDPEFVGGGTILLEATDEDYVNPQSRIVEVTSEGKRARYVRVSVSKLAERQRDYIFALAEVEVLDAAGTNVAQRAPVSSLDTIEAPVRWGMQNLTDGRYWQHLWSPEKLDELVGLEQRQQAAKQAVFTPEVKLKQLEFDGRLAALKQRIASFPPADMVYAVATDFSGEGQFQPTGGKVRPIRLLIRGDLQNPSDFMLPGAPELWQGTESLFVQPMPSESPQQVWDEGAARAGLARYVTDRNNPLFWRSMANRVWQWTFGQPLVGTPNDFGRMGMLPTHPELLDYLAARLRDDPRHSLKSLVRLLVTSQSYRRSSENIEMNLSMDAGNRFYWKANRRKLTAEEFRDSMLSVSGILVGDDQGGKSFQDFVVEKPEHSPHYEYDLADPNNAATFRRSIYRFVVRSQPQPMMTVLDCADPSISVPQRDESTTALQALTQWNDRLVEAMSVHFANRLRREVPPADESSSNARDVKREQIRQAYLLSVGRRPDPDEEQLLEQLHEQHGLEVVARVIFNMSAFNYVD